MSIQIKDHNALEVTDKTLLGSNVTKVVLGDEEVEKVDENKTEYVGDPIFFDLEECVFPGCEAVASGNLHP